MSGVDYVRDKGNYVYVKIAKLVWVKFFGKSNDMFREIGLLFFPL